MSNVNDPFSQNGYSDINQTSIPPAGISNLATPGARLGAHLLDILFAVVTLGIGYIIWALIVWDRGTTPGHQVLRQYVIDTKTGRTCTWGQMALREFVFKGIVGGFASFFSFGIYYVVDSLFVVREDRKTLHDMMANTVVVQR